MKAGNIQRSNTCKYLGIVINKEENLKGIIEELERQCKAISGEIETTGSKNQVRKETRAPL